MERRNGEAGGWKLLRLWPILVALIPLAGLVYVSADDIIEVKDATNKLWLRTGENREAINELKQQTGIIEYRLGTIDDALKETKVDIKEILREVRKLQ